MKRNAVDLNPDFRCIHCTAYVSAQVGLAGVQHRNHCPYCLWSRHMDLRSGGDRLSACKSAMEPIGLTLKRLNKKYARDNTGELMLVHHCTRCGTLSINRIASDDLEQVLLEVFERGQELPESLLERIRKSEIALLTKADRDEVHRQLFGRTMG
jgi:hypothetical protein